MPLKEAIRADLDDWVCSILEHEEGWALATCWRKDKKKANTIPAEAFATCSEEVFEEYGLPKYVARKLARLCRSYKVIKEIKGSPLRIT